jgi:hypothetical protein
MGMGINCIRDWIYWTSFTNNTIYRVDKETGSKFEVVKTELSRLFKPVAFYLCVKPFACIIYPLPTPPSHIHKVPVG